MLSEEPMSKSSKDVFSEKETKQRFDAMLKGALKSPPKPLKDIPKTATAKRRALKKKKGAL
jgi:hypothetical protein